ncbi:MAG: zinc-ribbon domain-containing protein [Pseudolysinimonas sp.]
MTCHYCGTALPDGALFCGECGQPVTAVDSEGPARPSTGFSIADLAFSSPGETSQPDERERDLPDGSPPDAGHSGDSAAGCPQCGEPMADGDVFCGECGFVLRAVTPPSGINLITLGEYPAEPDADEPDAEEPDAEEPVADFEEPVADFEAPDADATTEVEPLSASGDSVEIEHLVVESDPGIGAPAPETDPDLEFDDPPLPFSEPDVMPAAKASPRSRPIPDPFPWGTDQPLREDLEATRLVADSAAGARYVLQFSTGESVTVTGSGLVGRNPSMQPGEYVDQLVPIFDAGKSVSKTHLEFGQEAGRFWVSDRYSTNGSVIRQPDADPRRCDAGRRYFIARGTRVDVGEQFFVVS